MSDQDEVLLAIDEVVAGYENVAALHGVSFKLRTGRSVAVLGPNGAGKSTLARTLAGFIAPMSGTITFDGGDISGLPAHVVARRGLVRLPETRGIFPNLTVDENLVLGVSRAPSKVLRKVAMERIRTEFPMFQTHGGQLAGTLSGGEQQLLALCHVVAIPPRLLVADELSLGLAPIVLDHIYDLLNTVRSLGTAVVLIEQFFDRALAFADSVVVLRRGVVVMEGETSTIEDQDHLRQMMAMGE